MFLRIALASPEQLGFDPTVRRHELWKPTHGPSLRDCYDIDVSSPTGAIRTFRTTGSKLLYGLGQAAIQGRGTRVWIVNEVIDDEVGEASYVLKDVWIQPRERTPWQLEGSAYEAVSSFIDDHPEFEDCRENFLSVVTHGLVPGGDTDVMHHGLANIWLHPMAHSWDKRGPLYQRKLHYRIVFKEIGTPLWRLGSDDTAFTAISGAVRGERCFRVPRSDPSL